MHGDGYHASRRRPGRVRRWRATSASALALVLAGAALAAPAHPASAAGAPAAGPAPLLAASGPAVSGSYVVVLKGEPGSTEAARTASAADRVAALGATVTRRYTSALNGFAARLTPSQVDTLRADPTVAYVAVDQQVRTTYTQTPATWGLDRIDQRNLPLNNTYTYEARGSGVNAYVIDTGIRTTHTEFHGLAYNAFSIGGPGFEEDDCNGHGTHVAGTVAGITWGVAKWARPIGVRVLDCSGFGAYSNVIAGVDWVTSHAVKPAVVNMSLGGEAYQPLDDAVRRSIATGLTYVVAAGNENRDACTTSPARVAEAITVAASTNTDSRWVDSNWGSCVDVFAPGKDITSSYILGDNVLITMSGTSMASPHVAGAAAHYLELYPDATPAQVSSWITQRATQNALSNVGTGSPNRLLHLDTAATRPGMTWSVRQQRGDNVVWVGHDGQSDAYQGDTPASTTLPALCIRPRPMAEAPVPTGVVPDQHAGWSFASVALSTPVPGTRLLSPHVANLVCQYQFGAGWRMAEFHDGRHPVSRFGQVGWLPSGWSLWANGTLPTDTRFWVRIDDQAANPWESSALPRPPRPVFPRPR
ncbi:S8 family peptidase [Micromonospora sp. NPDC050397]|uniref:S8 family peptidase n=1 Tax=Micromonospora sp. NPDC050397 TaxID=3364279 RepID=UPI00384B1E1C